MKLISAKKDYNDEIAMRTKRSDIMSIANKILTPTENDNMAIPCDILK